MATSKNQYNIKAVLLFFFISINAIQLTAQDFHYSQFFNTPLTTNPGNTGVFNGDIRVYSMYRMQWFTVTTPYKTLSFAADAPIFKKKMKSRDFFSAGINVNNDNVGDVKLITNSFHGLFSFTKYLGGRKEHDVTVGFQAGYVMKTAALGNLKWDSQYDPFSANYNAAFGVNEGNVSNGTGQYIDISTGLVWNFTSSPLSRSTVGFSLHHLNFPNATIKNGTDGLHPKFGFQWTTAYKKSQSSATTILPSVMVAVQGGTFLINGGANIKYVLEESSHYTGFQSDKAIYLGAFYRFRDAAYVTFRFDYRNYTFAVAYDINLSKLTPASKSVGAFEFMLQYRGAFGKERYSKRASTRFM